MAKTQTFQISDTGTVIDPATKKRYGPGKTAEIEVDDAGIPLSEHWRRARSAGACAPTEDPEKKPGSLHGAGGKKT